MNQRMIELYQEASEFAYKICREEGREGGTGDHIWNMLSTGKFAELIVKECLTIVERKEYSYHEADPLWETAELIKEHFGVEQ